MGLQHTGGTGMEDVSLAGCIHKWGGISVVSYLDADTEVITSEAAANRTEIKKPRHEDDSGPPVPPCTFVVHSLRPDELAVVATNVQLAWDCARAETYCRPDAVRLQTGLSTMLAPAERPQAPGAQGEVYQWPVYGDREFAVLLSCSTDTLSRWQTKK